MGDSARITVLGLLGSHVVFISSKKVCELNQKRTRQRSSELTRVGVQKFRIITLIPLRKQYKASSAGS